MSARTSGAGAARANAGELASAMMPAGLGMWGPMFGASTRWNEEMQQGFAQIGKEWLEFVARRTKEDLNLAQRLCACRSPEDVWDLYMGYWQRLLDDYRNEYAEMAKLGSGLADKLAAGRWQQPGPRSARSHAKAA